MFDFAAVDVALGLIFVYLILSLVCSALNEAIASVLAWRADLLRQGLKNLASSGNPGDTSGDEFVKALWNQPLIHGLIRHREPALRGRWNRSRRYPSYIPSRTFVAAVLKMTPNQANAALEDAIANIPNPAVKAAMQNLYTNAEKDAKQFTKAAEAWFDDAMERVSGWYRRRVQIMLWLLALAVSIAVNADTIHITRNLWSDKTVRAAVVASAESTLAQSGGKVPQAPDFNEIGKKVDQIEALQVPLGWSDDQNRPTDFTGWAAKVLGLLLTAAALSLGAPFWFDALSKIARIRSSGAPPPATDSRRTGEGAADRFGEITIAMAPTSSGTAHGGESGSGGGASAPAEANEEPKPEPTEE